jgi:hypothetical protein
MARFKDTDWNVPTTAGGGSESMVGAQLAVLMDIRDELKRLNSLMYCMNTVQIPHTLKRIDRRLATKLPLKAR